MDLLEQHPSLLASIHSSLLSPSFSWFLWEVVVSATAGLHQEHQGVSPACRVGVPSDHEYFSSQGGRLLPAGAVDYHHVWKDLLLCLQHVYLAQSAGEMVNRLALQGH
jgi:hypothetical protein